MLIVVGGHSRNIGKTSVVCGIIRALPEWNWTAIKITQYGHGVCSREGEPCECADPRHPVAISEEDGAAPQTDSGRFLAAGARQSFWVRTPAGSLGEAMSRLRRILTQADHAIIESNSLLQFVRPDLYLMAVDGGVADFKPSSRRFLDRADALIVTSGAPLVWAGVSSVLYRSKPRFVAPAPLYENPDLIAAIRQRRGENYRDVDVVSMFRRHGSDI
jgi:hypothetical protein